MGGLDPRLSIADNYRTWGRHASGHSPAYETLSYAVADENIHAPNEFFRLTSFDEGLRAWTLLLGELPGA